jgi:DNA-binding transcriptional LysR family regulator
MPFPTGHPPNLKHLRTFLTVAEENSFTRAAALLNMTQPGVSVHLRKLEDYLGLTLIERFNRQFLLTQAGRDFLPAARDILARAEAGLDQILARQGPRGWVKIAAPAPFSDIIFRHLPSFRRSFPDLQLSLETMASAQVLERLAAGELDFGLVTHFETDPRFSFLFLSEEPLVLTGAKPASPPRVETPEAFLALPFVDHPSRLDISRAWIAHHFPDAGDLAARMKLSAYVDSLETGIQMVLRGVGCGVSPLNGLLARGLEDGLAVIEGPNPVLPVQKIHIATRNSGYLRHAAELFITHLTNQAAAEQPV